MEQKDLQWFLDDEAKNKSGVNLKYESFEDFRKERMKDMADIESIYELRLAAYARFHKHELENAEKQNEMIYDLFNRPAKVLKPLEDLWRKENARSEYTIPDRTKFYTWIKENFFRMRAQLENKCDCGRDKVLTSKCKVCDRDE